MYDYDINRWCAPTDYAVAQGVWQSSSYVTIDNIGACWWWLRSPGAYSRYAARVIRGGYVDVFGSSVYFDDFGIDAVRPVLFINLKS